ncbi:MAG: FAD-dependent monooxygenase [Pseudomonadota bacterium]
MKNVDILIAGGGLAGLSAAYSLAKLDYSIALVSPKTSFVDTRTTALLHSSVEFFKKLEIWDEVATFSHPLKTMRIVDASTNLIRMPQGDFHASEIDLEAFGYNVQNKNLLAALNTCVKAQKNIEVIDGSLTGLEPVENHHSAFNAEIDGQSASFGAKFIVGADGRNSKVREYFKFGEKRWSYPQTALVLDFEHEKSSEFVSTEFHTKTGPFTIVPRSTSKAGLVWLETPQRAQEILNFSDRELDQLLETQMHSYLGKISAVSRPISFPMEGLVARRFGNENHALVGEAAHVFPPIGAQGYNLGIRDVEALIDVMKRFASTENRGEQYHKARFSDVTTRTMGVDLLNRSLLSQFLPVKMFRSTGMHFLNRLPALRKQIMKMGISPASLSQTIHN